MDPGDKLLDRLRRTPFGWNPDDLRRLYEAYGFDVHQGARHLVVQHHEQRDLVTTVARHDELSLRQDGRTPDRGSDSTPAYDDGRR